VLKCVIALTLLASASWAAAAAKPVGIVTILQGRATVIRALTQFDALEGVRLLADDLVRTGKDTFLRVEYEDETRLELGPETVLQLNHPAGKRATRPALYLLTGWLKIGSGKASGDKLSLALPGVDLVDLSGATVVRATQEADSIFAEQGTARWIDRAPHGAEPITLSQGDFLVAGPDKSPKVQGRPTADFMGVLPRAYRDTIPYRYGLFKSRAVTPKEQRSFSYAEVQPWLEAEPSVRRQFVALWRRKAHEPDFRAALDRDLPLHPEWDPVLHPEKYEPKVPPHTGPAGVNAPAAATPAPVSSATPINH
jgi:hypothetical protein